MPATLATQVSPDLPRPRPSLFTRRRIRSAVWQTALAVALLTLGYVAHLNITRNLAASGVSIDFGFLAREAGFDVSEQLIAYTPKDSYARVLLVGLLNTLLLAATTLVAATVVGLMVGVALTSRNWLLRTLARVYVELLRNLPKLLVILAIYVLMVRRLPLVRAAWPVPGGGFLSNRGLYLPWPEIAVGGLALVLTLAVWLGATMVWARIVKRRQDLTGRRLPVALPSLAGIALALAALLGTGLLHVDWSMPVLKGFNIVGGAHLTVQFTALWVSLSVYHASQIAEIVRGGIVSVDRGQREAALAQGLRPLQILRLIVLPQAIRVIVPPLGNQYLNLIKNTSIALAVGYSDLVGVMNTAVNQTFRPVELMAVVMVVFLAINLTTAAALNWFAAATRPVGR
ncbi:amino acid ABC transporter permease [Siculibacillus lacustris]|nr:ABC transporter permease subunit [Siculibacillus lacustris]